LTQSKHVRATPSTVSLGVHLLALSVALWGGAPQEPATATSPPAAATGSRRTAAAIETLTIQSKVLGEERRILVRLPRHYELDNTDRYAVVYKFDGDNQLKRFDDAIDVLSSAGTIPDLIVVAIPNARGGRNRDLTPGSLHQEEAPNGAMGKGEMGRGDLFLDFVEKELIPFVDQKYRTTSERILAGHSRGALVVLQSLLIKPDLFQARFIFSAPLTRDERRMITDTTKFLAGNPKLKPSFLYFNWGENENEGMNQSYLAMKSVLGSKTKPKGLRCVIERAHAADHQSTPFVALPSALHHYFVRK
jgi:predicted alpha/beta superfamily hydrolase